MDLADAAIDLGPVVARGLVIEARPVLHRSHLRIGSTEIEPTDSREGGRGGTHGAGLQGDIEIATDKALAAERARSFADHQQLGMGGRIVEFDRAVAGGSQYLPCTSRKHRAHRHLVADSSTLGFLQCQLHGPRDRLIHARLKRPPGARRQGACYEATMGKQNQSHPGERIAKVIARAGVCSRRDAERLIAEGRVRLNSETVDTPARKVQPEDRVEIDGAPLRAREASRLWRYHKPAGLIVSHRDPKGRPSVFDALPKSLPRVMSIGRLDFTTEGLLLLTNDGELERKLELPATGWTRRYRVRVHGTVEQAALDRLKQGIEIGGIRYGPIEARIERRQGTNLWLSLALKEGKNREIKRVCEHLGLQVTRLIRISYGPFQLGDLGKGEVVEVPPRILRDQLGGPVAAKRGA
jgi:23S rRNA pseudouridine2605 synthase